MEVVKRHSLAPEEVEKKKEDFSKLVDQGVAIVPDSVKPYLEKAGPLIKILYGFYFVASPFIWAAKEIIEGILVVLPLEVLEIIIGFFFCFFGGNFVLIMAAYKAFMLCGWETTKRNFQDIKEEYLRAKAITDELLSKDNDGDGIADIDQINQAQLMVGRLSTFASACKEPEKITRAVGGIFSALLGVVAALSAHNAQVVVLGCSLGQSLSVLITPFCEPMLKSNIDEKNHHWISTGLSTATMMVSVTIAFVIQSALTVVQTSLAGAQQMATNFFIFASSKGWLTVEPNSSTVSYVSLVFAGLGIFYQCYSNWFPFPLNLICAPAFFLEHILYIFFAPQQAEHRRLQRFSQAELESRFREGTYIEGDSSL